MNSAISFFLSFFFASKKPRAQFLWSLTQVYSELLHIGITRVQSISNSGFMKNSSCRSGKMNLYLGAAGNGVGYSHPPPPKKAGDHKKGEEQPAKDPNFLVGPFATLPTKKKGKEEVSWWPNATK